MSTIDSISPLQKDIDLRCHTASPLTVTSLKRTRANSTSIMETSTDSSVPSSYTLSQIMPKLCRIEENIDGIWGARSNIIPPKDTRPKNDRKFRRMIASTGHSCSIYFSSTRTTGNLVNIQSTSNTHSATPAGHTSDGPITSLSTTSRPIRNTKPPGLPPIIGNSSEHIDRMAIVPKKRSVIVRDFAKKVSIDTIVQFLHNKGIINPVVLKMVSFEQSIFHITVQQQQLTEIFISELWPSGVM
ncbi:hypothetical protein SNEBB_002341, partial [Seison nebaliae]